MLGAGKSIRLTIIDSTAKPPAPIGTETILTAGPALPILETPVPIGAVLNANGATLTGASATKSETGKKFTLSGAGLTITAGSLRVAPDTTLEIAGDSGGAVALTTTNTGVNGSLILAAGGKLAFKDDSTNAGTLVIGATTIDGDGTTITAVGGDITLADDAIVGSAAGTTLMSPAKKAGDPPGAITSTIGVTTTLTLKQVELDLTGAGSLEIANGTAIGVFLRNRAKITLVKDADGVPFTGATKITGSTSGTAYTLPLSGTYCNAVTVANAAAGKELVWSVAHNGGEGDVSIGADTTTQATLGNKAKLYFGK
jgi:hypothetical protein